MSLRKFNIGISGEWRMLVSPVYIIFVFLLIFTPLAFGTVEPWSLFIMEAMAFTALLLYLAGGKDRGLYYKVPGVVPLVCIILYHLVQIIPLPAGFVRAVSPGTQKLYEQLGGIVTSPQWMSLSVHKKASVEEFFRLSAAAAFYVITVQLLSGKELLKRTILILLTFCGLLALLSLTNYFFYNGKIYWIRTPTLGGSPYGPFVNRNHYAGFMGMVFPVALSIFLFYKPHVSYSTFREKLVELLNRKRTGTYILTGLSAVLIAVSVFFSLSRSGITSLGLSVLFFGLLPGFRRTRNRTRTVVIVACMLILLSVTWIGWDPIISRFEKVYDSMGQISDNRAEIWEDTLSMISDFSFFGSGFGTFIDVYPKYRSFPGDEIYDHAHNDYLELVSDGGVAGALLYFWFFSSIFISSFRTFRKRKELYSSYLYAGSLSGMVYMLFHSITDFNLHIGSNGFYFFFLAGLLISSANTRLREGNSPTLLVPRDRPPAILSTIPVAIILTLCIIFHLGGFIGKYYHSSLKDISIKKLSENTHLQLVLDTELRAVFFDPFEPEYRLGLAEIEAVGSGPKEALTGYTEAALMNPFNSLLIQRLGLAYSEAGDIKKAEMLLKTGILLDAKASYAYKTFALWLFEKGRTKEGIANFRTALAMNPGRTREFIILMVRNRLTKPEIGAAMPERLEPHLIFARHLSQIGYDDMADDEYRKAFDFIKNEKAVTPGYFLQAVNYFVKKRMYDDAVIIMRKGVEALPSDIELRLAYGDLYLTMDMGHRALEEYEKALLLDPRSLKVKGKLENARQGAKEAAGEEPGPE